MINLDKVKYPSIWPAYLFDKDHNNILKSKNVIGNNSTNDINTVSNNSFTNESGESTISNKSFIYDNQELNDNEVLKIVQEDLYEKEAIKSSNSRVIQKPKYPIIRPIINLRKDNSNQ